MIPHVPLSQVTEVEHLEHASSESGASIWVKRDDRTAEAYGGNKVRKLEFLLAEARHQGCDTLVTAGATGSHHVLATSIYGRRWGFDVHAVMVPQPMSPHVEENLRADLAVGAELHRVPVWAAVPPAMAALSARLRLRGRSPYTVAYGGSSPTGALGFVEAGLELAQQIARGEAPEPDAIFVALGSGGTAAGLAIGLRAAGLTTPLIAVRVTPWIVCNRARVASLVAATTRSIRDIEPAFPHIGQQALAQIHIDGSQYGRGYGTDSPPVQQALALSAKDGLSLDATYTARAFAAMVAAAGRERAGQRLLFWHTLSSADLRPLLEMAPPLPAWAT